MQVNGCGLVTMIITADIGQQGRERKGSILRAERPRNLCGEGG
jgi:hypothetical protein